MVAPGPQPGSPHFAERKRVTRQLTLAYDSVEIFFGVKLVSFWK